MPCPPGLCQSIKQTGLTMTITLLSQRCTHLRICDLISDPGMNTVTNELLPQLCEPEDRSFIEQYLKDSTPPDAIWCLVGPKHLANDLFHFVLRLQEVTNIATVLSPATHDLTAVGPMGFYLYCDLFSTGISSKHFGSSLIASSIDENHQFIVR